MCSHGTPIDIPCWLCDGIVWELDDNDRENVSILLENATLTGIERSDLEAMLEYDDMDSSDRERLQELVNSHLSVLHQHQK